MNKTSVACILTSLVALSYMYYKLRPIQVIIEFDVLLPHDDEQIQDDSSGGVSELKSNSESKTIPLIDLDSDAEPSCIKPLRADKELLSLIGRGGDEIIYNICEILTLLDAYLEKENLITNQVITINDKLDLLLKKDAPTINYDMLVKELLKYHTSKY